MHDTQDDTLFPRRIRSFVKRSGRMTPSQQQALDNLWPTYGLELSAGKLDFADLFGKPHQFIQCCHY